MKTDKRESYLKIGGRGNDPLFGSDYVQGAAQPLTFNHYVFQITRTDRVRDKGTAKLSPKMAAKYDKLYGGNSGVKVVGRINSQYRNKRTLVHDEHTDCEKIMIRNDEFTWEGRDPHEVFYRQALAVRKLYNDRTDEVIKSAGVTMAVAKLLTQVTTPITTFAADFGFHVGCEYGQRVVLDHVDPDTLPGEIYSVLGEYPIDIPSNIDVEKLMRIDQLVTAEPDRLELDLRLDV